MSQKNKNLEFTFNLKLSKEDRKKLNFLQENGFNMSEKLRQEIRKLYEKNKDIDE